MPRLFTALEIPARSAQSLAMLRGGLPGARWIDPENYHITLRFIGDVDDALAHEIASMLGQVQRPAFDLRSTTCRLRRHAGRARSWRRSPPDAAAAGSAGRARAGVQRVGLEPEGRKFTPHVTLARLRDSSSRQVADYLAVRAPFRSSPFPVGHFVLFSSRASVGGGPYVIEAAYPLAA